MRPARGMALLGTALLVGGCAEPRGTDAERRRAEEAGSAYGKERAARELPALGEGSTVDDLLRHAFQANAALEAAYHDWRAALEEVPQAASWMQPEVSLKYLTSSGRMRAWDRTTLGVTQTIPTAGKRGLAADAALSEAVAARRRFEQAKFDLQASVLAGAADYVLIERSIETGREGLRFLRYMEDLAAARQKAGVGRQQDLLRAQVEAEQAENELRMLQARRPAASAALNALLGRPGPAPLPVPPEEEAAAIPADDARILALAAERNPELAAMAQEVRGREDALAIARRAWVPDLTLGFEVMGDVEASVMGMAALPFQAGAIRARIRQAADALSAARARLTSGADTLQARTVTALAMARDADRQARLYAESILPKAEQTLSAAIAAYGAGGMKGSSGMGGAGGDFLDVLDSQRTVLETRLALARVRAERAKAVAELEAILATDRSRWAEAVSKEGESR